MAVKRHLVTISPLPGCQEELQNPPELGFRDDGGFGYVSWKIMAAPRLLGQGGFYRRRGDERGAPGATGGQWAWPHQDPRLGVAPGPCVASWVDPLDSVFVLFNKYSP